MLAPVDYLQANLYILVDKAEKIHSWCWEELRQVHANELDTFFSFKVQHKLSRKAEFTFSTAVGF